jgi:hypothetical protein
MMAGRNICYDVDGRHQAIAFGDKSYTTIDPKTLHMVCKKKVKRIYGNKSL